MQPLSGNQRPDLLTSLMNMSFVLRLPREMHLWRSSPNVPRLPSFWKCYKTITFCSFLTRCASLCACHAKHIWTSKSAPYPSVFLHFWHRNVIRATTACTFSTSQLPKVVRTPGVFLHFYLEMRFALQRRALFRHLNFQKRSEAQVCFVHCASRHNGVHFFRHLNFEKWSEREVFFSTCECASRHNGVQFFISHLASWLRTRRFSEPTFRPSGPTNHWKNTVFRDFPTFSGTWIFFLLTLSLFDILSSSLLFSSLTLTTSAFSSVHIVGSLTSKLPSVTICVSPEIGYLHEWRIMIDS